VRIVSLLPSATEIVADLGLADSLVGRSEECDYPPRVRDLPVVTASRVDTSALGGAEIDAAVRAALAEGRSLYAVDAELLDELRPDVILTQDLCTVCAVSTGELAEVWGVRTEAISLGATTIEELLAEIERLAARLGVADEGTRVADATRARISTISECVARLPRPRVAVLEWLDPPFAPGHWVPEMVGAAGGHSVLGTVGRPSFGVSWDDVPAARPEIAIAAPCGYDRARAAAEAAACVPDLGCPVVAVDANAHFSRSTPRIADGIAELAELLHPGALQAVA